MTDNIDYFKKGQQDCRLYYQSQAYSSYTKSPRPEDAMRLFFPPENEMLSQMEMPRPKPKQKWLAGFKKEQIIIQAEMKIKCLHCDRELLPEDQE
jgi:hypothetical protein